MVEHGGSKVVALACSAGGLMALFQILSGLPSEFPAPIIVAQHRGDQSAETLVQLLSARTNLRVKSAEPMERMQAGCVYICPPGCHIELADEHMLLSWRGPRIDFVRPSCNLLFESVAETFGQDGICVILTGCGSDGALATRRVHQAGGFVIAQDQGSSDYPDMPAAAVEFGRVDLVLALRDIPFALCELVYPPPRMSHEPVA